MKTWLTKYKFFVLGGLAVAMMVIAYGMREYNRRLPDTHTLTTAFHFEVDNMRQQFELDEINATKKFGDKVISLKGVVGSVQVTDTTATVFLNDQNAQSCAVCQFDPENILEVRELQKGMSVNIKGICTGYLMDIIMVRCVVDK